MTTQSHSTKRRLVALTLGGAVGVGAFVSSANAQVVLTDGSATVRIDPTSQAGVYDFELDNIDQLAQQWYWYRVGNTAESSIDTLTLNGVTPAGANQATLSYGGTGFDIEVTYTLTGGPSGSGAGDLAESIQIFNTSGNALDLTFFLYSDFDLGGTPGGDRVTSVSWSPFPISNPGYNSVSQFDGLNEQQTTFGEFADRAEADFFAVTLNHLNDGGPSSLANSGSGFGPVGDGDVTYAFQWDLTIAAGSSEIIGVDKRLDVVIPEPTTAALGLFGGLSLLYAARRRRV